FGWTAWDVRCMARGVVKRDSLTWWADASDRFETAWFAIVEALYQAEEAPTRQALYLAAHRGVQRLFNEEAHHSGVQKDPRSPGHGRQGAAPMFAAYWSTPSTTGPRSPVEDPVVDRLGAAQIFAVLLPCYQRALIAAATHEDTRKAAAE